VPCVVLARLKDFLFCISKIKNGAQHNCFSSNYFNAKGIDVKQLVSFSLVRFFSFAQQQRKRNEQLHIKNTIGS
jgi:hypothetical protein